MSLVVRKKKYWKKPKLLGLSISPNTLGGINDGDDGDGFQTGES